MEFCYYCATEWEYCGTSPPFQYSSQSVPLPLPLCYISGKEKKDHLLVNPRLCSRNHSTFGATESGRNSLSSIDQCRTPLSTNHTHTQAEFIILAKCDSSSKFSSPQCSTFDLEISKSTILFSLACLWWWTKILKWRCLEIKQLHHRLKMLHWDLFSNH